MKYSPLAVVAFLAYSTTSDAFSTTPIKSTIASLNAATVEAPPIESLEDEFVDFPPPLTPIQRATRAVEFYKRALPVLAAYKAKELQLQFQPVSSEEEEEIWKEIDEWGSTRIAETIQEMKGFYVKTGKAS